MSVTAISLSLDFSNITLARHWLTNYTGVVARTVVGSNSYIMLLPNSVSVTEERCDQQAHHRHRYYHFHGHDDGEEGKEGEEGRGRRRRDGNKCYWRSKSGGGWSGIVRTLENSETVNEESAFKCRS